MNSKLEFSAWKKAQASGNGTGCVEVGSAPGFAGVRDTKDREAGHIAVPAAQWTAFLDDVKAGKFDLS